MRERELQALGPAGYHRLAYTEWGDPGNPRVLVCVHGLTRNGRDFDDLAQGLADHYRVLCPDVVGRGRSDWLVNKGHYNYPQYMADMSALIARSGAATVDWVGTSMGGLIGMSLAAQPGTPLRRLVLNDVGSFIPKAALEGIGRYVGLAPVFPDMAGVEAYLRQVNAGFGNLTDAQWAHLARYSAAPVAEGGWRLLYDPAIGDPFRLPQSDVDLTAVWQAVPGPVMLIRGAQSGLLLPATVAAMAAVHPGLHVIEVANCGHAPALMDALQIAAVRDFLLGAA